MQKRIDRLSLHRELWDNSDRLHRIVIYQKSLASKLGITQATMSLIIKELVQEGKIKKIAAKQANVGIYVVRDPSIFEHEFEPYRVIGFDIERCKLCGAFFDLGPHLPKQA